MSAVLRRSRREELRGALERVAARQTWSDASQVEVCLAFIESCGCTGFDAFLREFAEAENALEDDG